MGDDVMSTPHHHGGSGPEASPVGRRRARAGARGWLAAGAVGALLGTPVPAAAHGLGQPYELPVPLGLYLTGAGLAVGLSFLLMAWFMRRGASPAGWAIELDRPFADRLRAGPVLRWTLRLGALAVFTLLVAAGLLGAQQPFKNIMPIAIWVLWWVGFAYLAAFVGDLWPVVNPWATVYDLVRGGRPPAGPLATFPARWGVAPAALAFVSFAAMELAWSQSEVPRSLAFAMLGYSAFTWVAMALFGRDVWLARGEVFSVYFAVLGRFAPLAVKAGNPHRRLVARPFAVGLLVEQPVPPTMLGLGASTAQLTEGLHDVPFAAPLERLRRVIVQVRALLAGHRIPLVATSAARPLRLGIPAVPGLPIFVAGLTPASIRLTGELADGWLPFLFPRSRLGEGERLLREGAVLRSAGGSLAVCPVVPTAVGDNGAGTRDRAVWFVVFYLTNMSELYRRTLTRQGYAAEVEGVLAANPPRTAPVVPRSAETLLEELTIFGSPAAARAQLARWYEAGASMPVLLLPPDLTADEIDRTLRAFRVSSAA